MSKLGNLLKKSLKEALEIVKNSEHLQAKEPKFTVRVGGEYRVSYGFGTSWVRVNQIVEEGNLIRISYSSVHTGSPERTELSHEFRKRLIAADAAESFRNLTEVEI